MPEIVVNLTFLGNLGKGGSRFAQGLLTACEELTEFKQLPVTYLLSTGNGSSWVKFPGRNYQYVSDIYSVDQGILGGLARYLVPPKSISPQAIVYNASYQSCIFAKNQIVTLFDVIPLRFPNNNIRQYLAYKIFIPIALKKALHIVTISQSSKEAIKKYYGVDDNKISVIYCAADINTFKPDILISRNNSLLSIGASWPHKNIHELLEMHSIWDSKYALEIISPESAYRSKLERFCNASGFRSRVNFLSGVDEPMLLHKCHRARALIYPSLEEGFGLPLVEAMSMGTPVVASDIPVHREVCGDAAIYITPGEKESWERAFAILDDEQMVAHYIQKGLKRSKLFSWSRSARQFTKLLKKFIK